MKTETQKARYGTRSVDTRLIPALEFHCRNRLKSTSTFPANERVIRRRLLRRGEQGGRAITQEELATSKEEPTASLLAFGTSYNFWHKLLLLDNDMACIFHTIFI
jgi:hypothetical protein